ncbi:MAG TPA: RsmB/NOP family class I SAM-dependent RNA methyltransferase [Candidatus Saccharimonadales bacterium]|nr:RsmB/NOP family class I SAM-dependent RNA methyltransferase [Candidatus Saccharimonadales bacterium]
MAKQIDKTETKRATWIARTASALNLSEPQTRELLEIPRQQSIRINTLRDDDHDTLTKLEEQGVIGGAFEWAPNGYELCVPVQEIRDNPLVLEGKVFIQNAASWLPVLALAPKAGERILDVCAAPGGKTSHIAALTNNQAELWANDNSRARLAKMRANFDRLGVHSVNTTLYDGTQLSRKLQGQQFDRILLDAPCSGEGMMQLGVAKDFATWSVAHIKRLQHLQKQLIMQAWQLLKPGGTLVYSTCTMAPEENEAVISYLLKRADDATVQPLSFILPNITKPVMHWNGRDFDTRVGGCLRLKPSKNIEAFFVCKLQKI